ncbi:MAG: glutamate---cysteine ligase / carboxylate-amine ligase [Solirubrobacteraceae bacterium]|jgi:carboxylate-amine ligase|nr:glutamate---cysteine ligase / carboxylate-amine ligase [Solirubrobacteraceae bacterium]
MEHAFRSPSYTVGVEEELMILDAETLDCVNAIEQLLEDAPGGEIKPELMESVLEIATPPCSTVAEIANEVRALRHHASDLAGRRGLRVASAGTHPFARWEDQRIVGRPRYRALVDELAFVARQELVFGMHVHVGIDDPETAIAVANGLREHVPVLVALSANSPFWRGEDTGMLSARVPIFKSFPRVGIPPFYRHWEDYQRRVARLVAGRLVEDYTYLWYDVRPHPKLGTVEIRAMDAQTRVEHTVCLTALIQSLVRCLAEAHAAGAEAVDHPAELLEANKWVAARWGLGGRVLDPATETVVRLGKLSVLLLDRLAEHAEDLGCAAELEGVGDLLEHGNGAERQRLVYGTNRDLCELTREIIAASAA